jgi:hypothetical protein
MRKSYQDYVKAVTNEVNKRHPEIVRVKQSEVAKVLRYVNKNFMTCLKTKTNKIQIPGNFIVYAIFRKELYYSPLPNNKPEQ